MLIRSYEARMSILRSREQRGLAPRFGTLFLKNASSSKDPIACKRGTKMKLNIDWSWRKYDFFALGSGILLIVMPMAACISTLILRNAIYAEVALIYVAVYMTYGALSAIVFCVGWSEAKDIHLKRIYRKLAALIAVSTVLGFLGLSAIWPEPSSEDNSTTTQIESTVGKVLLMANMGYSIYMQEGNLSR